MNTQVKLLAFGAVATAAMVVIGVMLRDHQREEHALGPPFEATQTAKLSGETPELLVAEGEALQARSPQQGASPEAEHSAPTPSPDVQRNPRDFSWKYDGKPADEIQSAYREVSKQLGLLHHKEAVRAVESGRGEAITRDQMSFRSDETSPDSIGGAFYSEHRQSFFKVILTREEVPELLALKDEVNWLFVRIEQLQPSPFEK